VKHFNLVVAILLSIVYLSGLIPPSKGFNLWITSFVIPVALIINHILLIISLVLRKKSTLYYFLSLLIGIPYLTGTIGIKHLLPKKDMNGQALSVLNYNIGTYKMRPHYYKNKDSARIALKNWILESESDIKCIQEFANVPWSKEFNVIDQLGKRGQYFYFSTDAPAEQNGRFKNGTLIISKFPIIRSGDVLSSTNGFNRIAYADIKVDVDTIRIVNVHLESMGLTDTDPRSARSLNTLKSQLHTILRKLKIGVFERSRQIRQLSDFIDRSPHPVVCAGDFNDLPYSYNYRRMKKHMKNSFEESGKGFGFTYNGGTLKALRIDNQFYTSGFRAEVYETLDSVKFSDHFPLRVQYLIEEAN
jgi:endonuclease/exonuclease/phosphatase family metal-dependent hydrolase